MQISRVNGDGPVFSQDFKLAVENTVKFDFFLNGNIVFYASFFTCHLNFWPQILSCKCCDGALADV